MLALGRRPACRRARWTEGAILSVLSRDHLRLLRFDDIVPPDRFRVAELRVASDDHVASPDADQRRQAEIFEHEIVHDHQRIAVVEIATVNDGQARKHGRERMHRRVAQQDVTVNFA